MNGKFERLAELGAKIKAQRESLGLTVQEVQERTKIRGKYLRAIEAGDDKIAPGEAYFGVFIKSYAEFLGLDGLEFSRLYKEMTLPAKVYKVPVVEKVGDGTAPSPSGRRRRPRRKKGAGRDARLLLTLILIVAVFWGVAKLYGHFVPAQDPNGASAVQTDDGESGEDLEPKEDPEEMPVTSVTVVRSDPNQEVTLFRINETPLKVDLEVSGEEDTRCWILAKADGERVVEKTLGPGEIVSITAKNEVTIRAGKPWVLTLVLNGHDLGVGGLYGPVKDITFRYDAGI